MVAYRRCREILLFGGLCGILLLTVRVASAEPTTDHEAKTGSPALPPTAALQVGALLHVDWILRRQSSLDTLDLSTGEPLNDDRLLLRRGRLRVTSERSHVGGWFELDANTVGAPEVRPFDVRAVVGWPTAFAATKLQVGGLGDAAVPRTDRRTNEGAAPDSAMTRLKRDSALSLSLGFQTVPFGFEAQEPATRRPVLERARFARAFFGQARDFALLTQLAYRQFRLNTGVTNGEPLGTGRYAGRDLNRGKDWVGRLGLDVPIGSLLNVSAGWSWLSGEGLSPGTPRTKDTFTWVDDNENGLIEVVELSPAPGEPATPSSTFSRSAVGGDVQLRIRVPSLGPLELRAEIARALNLDRAVEPADPIAAGRDLRHLGWVVGISQELFGIALFAVRYDVYDPDADSKRIDVATVVPEDRSYRTLSAATGVRLFGARFLMQFDFEDNLLGRDTNGSPTRLEDNRVTLRAEVVLP